MVWSTAGKSTRIRPVWHPRCGVSDGKSWSLVAISVSVASPKRERRKWSRLQLAIPVFVRSRDSNGKESLEFATAMNICAGGALVVVRRSLPDASAVSLEIPSAPLEPAGGLPRSSRSMRAKTAWISHRNGYHLVGLKFARPLSTTAKAIPRSLGRKAASMM